MDISRAAAGLFMRNGLRATRAEDIARAAGVAPRTFYRYFATKEESLGPVFAAGSQKWAEAVRDAPAQLPVPEALRHAIVATLTPGVGVRPESLDWVRALLRLAEANPALLRVWGEACQTAERTLAGVLAARAVAASEVATSEVATRAATSAVATTEASPVPLPTPSPTPSPKLRLTAATASAAVRVAVEAWAATDDAADGPDGPVALALRHLEALRGFPWSAE
ncbi:TetR family transcriptional regulator [Streptomyces sp. NBC_00203]|uniref:TetR family transcriptional regulator n=1 Tax=Streptomyces sp. NBC_00203 TaxID=2975680 RepID=UPI003244C0A2